MSKILITRAGHQAQRFVDNFCDLYGELYQSSFLLEPMIRIERRDVEFNLDAYDAILMTSQNAAFSDLKNRTVFRVGMEGIDTVQDIIRFVQSRNVGDKYLYLRGKDICCDLKFELTSLGYRVDEVVTYEALAVEDFSEVLKDRSCFDSLQAVTFFSARTAQIFMKLSQDNQYLDALKAIKVLCISETVLECAHSEFFKDVRVAKKPNARCMMDLIKECIDEHAE